LVLVHGAWHGAWCWARVAPLLRAAGFPTFAVTLTGLSDRAHLLSPAVGIEILIADVVGLIEAEELTEVVLVGHSFGGVPITGAADRIPWRIGHLVYLDAVVIGDGECAFDQVPPDVVVARRAAATASSGGLTLPIPPAEAFGVFELEDQAWLARRLTPHPLRTYEDRLHLARPFGAGLPRTYITCTDPIYPALVKSRDRVAEDPTWLRREIATGHDAMVTAPAALAAMLSEIAEGRAPQVSKPLTRLTAEGGTRREAVEG
jgi:pimeloyl-ACP methyl ester carboxylesterase